MSTTPLLSPPAEKTPLPQQISRTITSQPTQAASSATFTPAPTQIIGVRPASLTSDLLFISDNRLIRWDHQTRYGVVVADDVVEYSVDASSKSVALLRSRGISVNGKELFDIDLLDFTTKQTKKLISEIASIKGISISPDGNWLAFFRPVEKKVDGIRISAPEDIQEWGNISDQDTNHCSSLAWSPDSQSLLWCDRSSISISYVNQQKMEKLNEGFVKILDPKSNSTLIKVTFGDVRWSPAGRFASVRVFPEGSDVQWQAVLDTRTRRFVQIIDSYGKTESDASLAWLPDGTLVVAHATGEDQLSPPTIHFWNIIPTNTDMLVSRQLIRLDFHDLSNSLKLQNTLMDQNLQICLEWLQPTSPGLLVVGARVTNQAGEPVLVELNMSNWTLRPLLSLSPATAGILWAPDGNGFITLMSNGKVNFISIDTGETIELSPYSDTETHAFTWLNPELRR